MVGGEYKNAKLNKCMDTQLFLTPGVARTMPTYCNSGNFRSYSNFRRWSMIIIAK